MNKNPFLTILKAVVDDDTPEEVGKVLDDLQANDGGLDTIVVLTPEGKALVERELLGFDRKLTKDDINPRLMNYAENYILDYKGGFDFLVDVQKTFKKYYKLTRSQAKGILNCVRADLLKRASPKPEYLIAAIALRGFEVKDGTYTVVFTDGTRVTIRFKAGKRNWEGEQIVSFLNGPDNYTNYQGFGHINNGTFHVWSRYRDAQGLISAVAQIANNPVDKLALYGLQSGRCGICGRKLTVPESIRSGIGPVCRERY